MRFVHFADYTTVFASDSAINNAHATVNSDLVGVDLEQLAQGQHTFSKG